MGIRRPRPCAQRPRAAAHPHQVLLDQHRPAPVDRRRGHPTPDDPGLTDYWIKRRRRVKPPLDGYSLRLLAKQDGLCAPCGEHLLTADQPPQSPQEWERWRLNVVKRAIAAAYLTHLGQPDTPDGNRTRLVHASRHRGLRVQNHRRPAVVALS